MAWPSDGYIYVPDDEVGPLSQACTGAVVCNKDRTPPWIVVDHSIADVIVARWPGKLWRVTNIDAEGIEQASQHAHYTRAMAVTVCEEVPASRLFGEHGAAVCSIITIASQLDSDLVQALAASRHPDAGDAFSRAWVQWLAELGRSSDHLRQNCSRTLAIGGPGKRSPINCGFTVLHRVIWERADSVVGSTAFLDDEEGEKFLEPTWASTSNAMSEAAMAMGAPMLSGTHDRLILLAAWRAVFGDSTECTF